MNVVICGYGKMGRAIADAANARGHHVASIIDPTAEVPRVFRAIDARAVAGADVALEFTTPEVAESNVCALLEAGVPVVCGSTGWDGPTPRVERAVKDSGLAAVIAPNFSLGVNLFYAIVAHAAGALLATGQYDPWIVESHHRAKADAPSGTAKRLATLLAPANVPIASVRAGHEPGRHTVGFDGEHDEITLSHRARGRSGFASGAVLAAEWVRGRNGIFGFDAVIADLITSGLSKGGTSR